MLKKSIVSSLGVFLITVSLTHPTQAAEVNQTLSKVSDQSISSHASLNQAQATSSSYGSKMWIRNNQIVPQGWVITDSSADRFEITSIMGAKKGAKLWIRYNQVIPAGWVVTDRFNTLIQITFLG
ncbi:hypothetical protein EDM57_19625 [Brevibacillus gelatini]|uniref:Uncharacterized protein n=1 Tax=Brevibacillus gelatini TaxID=1655277 RepID=A0A3M8ASF5_9BACL|nr:hypothetical protein [Brevibacillus gelatini]RNB53507.1 hypothetical protein EDM57_19625 [Brevibacillus gelatini]